MTITMTRSAFVLAALMLTAVGAQAAGMLAAQDGMTLYVSDKDKDGIPTCYDDCAKEWPAYVGKEGDTMGKSWTLVKRTDGAMQWAHDGKPVYFFKDDKKKGDKGGDGDEGNWHIVME